MEKLNSNQTKAVNKQKNFILDISYLEILSIDTLASIKTKSSFKNNCRLLFCFEQDWSALFVSLIVYKVFILNTIDTNKQDYNNKFKSSV